MLRRFLAAAFAVLALHIPAAPASAQVVGPVGAAILGAPDPYQGTVLAIDFAGVKTSGVPRYQLGATRYVSFTDVPGLSVSRPSTEYAEQLDGSLVSFASNIPAITNNGLAVWEARTNLLLQSNTFSTSWIAENASATANATTAPDATNTGWKLLENSSTATQHDYAQVVSKAASAITYTATIYAKAAERTWMNFQASDAVANGNRFFFNLSTCAADTISNIGAGFASPTFSASAKVNGWCRLSITFTSNTGTSVAIVPMLALDHSTTSYAGDGVSGAFIFGATLEQASFASPYNPTTSATATRAADSISISGLSVPTPYTLVAGVSLPVRLGGDFITSTPDLHNSQGIYYSGSVRSFVVVADVIVANPGAIVAPALGTPFGAAARFQTNDVNVAASRVLGSHVTSVTPLSMTTLGFGPNPNGGFSGGYPDGFIRRAVVYPRAFSDTELQGASQ
ncbi:phage head spike fiber domain-containing protein [Phenylobacterium sp.]|uniref:phage head spike fiber domain-containing protein n=1 Tax=Phenylobacterium sp. TaxID=1871053 RepID=UPI002DECECC0|nr:hypothetical protein [Phenylobacterium sp.]